MTDFLSDFSGPLILVLALVLDIAFGEPRTTTSILWYGWGI